MAPSPAGREKIFQCFDCPDGVQIFATEEALMTHKWDMIRVTRARSHMACHICKLDHRTFEGLVNHYQICHPAKQRLNCPACSEPFARLHILMRHLETNDCQHVDPRRVAENRRQQALITTLAAGTGSGPGNLAAVAAATGSHGRGFYGESSAPSVSGIDDETPAHPLGLTNQGEHLGIFNLSGVSIGEYGRYIGIESTKEDYERYVAAGGRLQLGETKLLEPTPGEPRPGLPEASAPGAPSDAASAHGKGKAPAGSPPRSVRVPGEAPPAVQSFRCGDTKAPDLLTNDANQQGFGVWGGGGQKAMVPQGQAKGKAASIIDGLRRMDLNDGSSTTALGRHHPDHPDFKVSRYRNPHSSRFNCPIDRCLRAGKNFKTAGGLIGHLRSATAHENMRVQCPSCFNYFPNLEALTQHCESPSVRCRFRDNEEYVPFLNILSGGVVDIQGRNIDLSVSYGVKETAKTMLLEAGPAESEEKEEDVNKEEWPSLL